MNEDDKEMERFIKQIIEEHKKNVMEVLEMLKHFNEINFIEVIEGLKDE